METEIIYKRRKATLITSNFQAPQVKISNFQCVVLPDVDFDADWSPDNPVNVEAARQRGLAYNSIREFYVDKDGYLIRDKFGQSL